MSVDNRYCGRGSEPPYETNLDLIAALEAEVAELLKVCDTARALAVPSLLAELEERGMPYTRKRVARLIDALSRYDARKAAGAEGT